jgi:hypothetical protein
MITENLKRILVRDLMALREEVRAYPEERDLWVCPEGIVNSAGTLALHLTGNVLHFIGAELGKTGYVRDRAAEFTDRNIPRAELEVRIGAAIEVVERGMERLGDDDMTAQYPLEVRGQRLPTGLFLTHLAAHLAYHLGQIDYHRRVVTGRAEAVGAQSIVALLDG